MDEKNSEILTEEMFERRRAVANTQDMYDLTETPMAINHLTKIITSLEARVYRC